MAIAVLILVALLQGFRQHSDEAIVCNRGSWAAVGPRRLSRDSALASRKRTHVYIPGHDTGLPMAAKHCTASREGKVLLSCWITEDLRMRLDRVWAAQGRRPHGRTQKGMEEMIAHYLAAQGEI